MVQPRLHTALRQFCGLLQTEQLAPLSDADLLERFVSDRDERAFALLVQRHGRLVWSACRQILRHEQDAEDAYQASFLVLVRHATSIRRGQTIACWLYRVASRLARKLAMDRAKRQAQLPRRAPISQEVLGLAWQEMQTILEEELAHLPEKHRAPFVLCCLDGKSKSEAARQLGWKVGTVSSRLAQARKHMQLRLTRRGVSPACMLFAAGLSLRNGAIPAGLAQATTSAACRVLTARAVCGIVSSDVTALIEGAAKMLLLSKLKTALSITLAIALLGTSAAAFAWQSTPSIPRPEEQGSLVAAQDFEPRRAATEQSPLPATEIAGNPWIGIASRETNSGPELSILFEDGTRRSYLAAADTVLLSYLPDYGLGGHEQLSVDLADTNRVLLRFDVPVEMRVLKAELILSRSQSRHPSPAQPMTLALHEVQERWQEATATWNRQPAFSRRPLLTARIDDPKGKEYRLDVTAPVRRVVEERAIHYGWLVRVDRPLPRERANEGAAPAGWSCFGDDYLFAVDGSVHHGGNYTCRIESRHPQARDAAIMSQTIRADDYRGQRIQFSGRFKTEGLSGMATLWMRVDGDAGLLGIDKSVQEAVRGNADWQRAHLVMDIPEDSKTIRFAVLIEGTGRAWIDDLKLEAVDRSVPLTNPAVNSAAAKKRKPEMPRRPVNLNFENRSTSG